MSSPSATSERHERTGGLRRWWANRIEALYRWVNDHVNPIVWRDAQRSLKGTVAGIAFLLFLVSLLVVALTVDDPESKFRRGPSVRLEAQGRSVYETLLFIYTLVAWIGVPTLGYRYSMEEKRADTYGLLSITTLGPGRLVLGRTFSALAPLLLAFSVMLPFASYAYLLRGIDLPAVAGSLFAQTAIGVLFLVLGVFLSASSTTKSSGAVVSALFLFLLFATLFGFEEWIHWLGDGGGGRPLAILVASSPLTVFLGYSALSALSPANSNHAAGVRVSALAAAGVWTGGGCLLASGVALDVALLASWVLLFLVGFHALGEPGRPSRRIVELGRRLPVAVRASAAVFFTGAPSGVLFAIGSLVGLTALSIGVLPGKDPLLRVFPAMTAYAIFLLGLSLLLLSRKRIAGARSYPRIVPIVVVSIASVLPLGIDYARSAGRRSVFSREALYPLDFVSPVLTISKLAGGLPEDEGLSEWVVARVLAGLAVAGVLAIVPGIVSWYRALLAPRREGAA